MDVEIASDLILLKQEQSAFPTNTKKARTFLQPILIEEQQMQMQLYRHLP